MRDSMRPGTKAGLGDVEQHRHFLHRDFRAKVIILFLLAALVLLNSAGWWVYFASKKSFEREAGHSLSRTAAVATENLPADSLKFLVPGNDNLYISRWVREILAKIKIDSGARHAFIIDETRHVLADARKNILIGTPCELLKVEDDDLELVLQGTTRASSPYRDLTDESFYIAAYAPIWNSERKIVGVLGLEQQLPPLGYIGELRHRLFLTGLFSFLVFVFLSFALTQSVVKPIRLLSISLSRERRYTEYILRSMGSGLITATLDGTVTVFNDAAAAILDARPDEVVGKKAVGALAGYPELVALLLRPLSGDQAAVREEMEIERPDGHVVTLGTVVSDLRDDRHRAIGASVIFTDLTETRRLERQIQLKERLAALGELSAGMAHEIRNPLEGIQLFTELLERRLDKEGDRELTKRIREEIKTLNNLVNNFLHFARPPRLERRDRDVREVLEEAIALALPRSRNGVEIDRSYEDVPPVPLDSAQMKQAFLNILMNALDALEANGRIGVAVRSLTAERRKYSDRGEGAVEIEVSNNGKPIPPGDIDKIFMPFFTTSEGGTGLGLPIVHRIIEGHGGDVWVESGHEQHTSFHVVLPVGSVGGERR